MEGMKRLLVTLILGLLGAPLVAQDNLYRLPPGSYTLSPGAVSFVIAGQTVTYVEGLGWNPARPLDEPLIIGQEVYGTADLLAQLEIAEVTPRVADVRFGGAGTVRVVLDIEGLDVGALEPLTREGRLDEGATLTLRLPELLLPLEQPDPYRGVSVDLIGGTDGVTLSLSAGEAVYRVFALANPTRLVLDVTPLSTAQITSETRTLRPGVVYRRFASPTGIGSSGVHLLEIAPGAGEFRVVGANSQAATVSALASGAFAAINAGYFDTRSLEAIGLLKVDYGILSLPYLQRASIGFGAGAPIIDRVFADMNVYINGRTYRVEAGLESPTLEVYTRAGQSAGGPTKGVITVSDGVVIANRVGPQTVPANGFALVYAPEIRELALVDAGGQASFDINFRPSGFANVRYAVEAGPLLVKNGFPAFNPDIEQFRRGERILDDYTQQAAIGVRADGTVLFVTADNMIAEELIPLMISLGAQDAMRLDSGGSTTLYIDGRVVNRSSERRVVSAIVFVPHN
jgi:hypothetical protein